MKFFALFAISVVFIASSECFRLNVLEENINEDRIYGGKTARPGQFPYMASLRRTKGNHTWRHECGGGILSNRWILTAAQCTLPHLNISNLAVTVGSHHISNDGQIYRLDTILIHPAFRQGGLINDASLLRTVKEIEFKPGFVQSIALRKQFVGADIVAISSGWGYAEERTTTHKTPYLQYLEVKTLTNPECRKRSETEFRHMVHSGTLCTYVQRTKGVCDGDSGNPLVANGTLIGLASWYQPCASGRPDLHARVSGFVYWIRKATGIKAV